MERATIRDDGPIGFRPTRVAGRLVTPAVRIVWTCFMVAPPLF
jgi:hypothetical protein